MASAARKLDPTAARGGARPGHGRSDGTGHDPDASDPTIIPLQPNGSDVLADPRLTQGGLAQGIGILHRLQRTQGNAAVVQALALRSGSTRPASDVNDQADEVVPRPPRAQVETLEGDPRPARAAGVAAGRASAVMVQRQPPKTADSPNTLTWDVEESSADVANLYRTTKVEADRWGEIGPAPPRIKYDRRVQIRTREGITGSLRISTTVYLRATDGLPGTAAEALRAVGRAARGGWTLNVEGGDVIPAVEGQFHEIVSATSLQALATEFPAYAALHLTPGEQEKALLRHIASLKRRRQVKADEPGTLLERAADVVTDFVPGLSNVKDLIIFATGVNPVTGEKVGWLGRLLSLVFAIPILGTLLKWVGKGGRLLAKHVLAPLAKFAMTQGGKLIKWIAKSKWLGRVTTWGGRIYRGAGKRLRSLIGAKKLKGAKAAQARAAFSITDKQVQKKFQKHAADFGVSGNWNPGNAANFRTAIQNHVQNTANDVIKGKYHGVPAIIHVNPQSGLAVVTDAAGGFVSGWKLSADQLRNVMAHGHLGGG